jgi:hypothetical protein
MSEAYVYQAAMICADCAEKVKDQLGVLGRVPIEPDNESTYDSDDYPKGPYPDGGGEADYPQHCDLCNVFMENPLTGDGYAYVEEALDNYPINETTALWRDYYSYERQPDGTYISPENPAR